MTWDTYTVFTLLSAIALLALAAAPTLGARDRLWSALGGVAFGGYAFYVAQQTSGTYYFPVWVFVVPIGAVIYLAITIRESRHAGEDPRDQDRTAQDETQQ